MSPIEYILFGIESTIVHLVDSFLFYFFENDLLNESYKSLWNFLNKDYSSHIYNEYVRLVNEKSISEDFILNFNNKNDLVDHNTFFFHMNYKYSYSFLISE